MTTATESISIETRDKVASQIAVVPAADPRAPVVLCMPAMGVRAAYYRPLATALAAAGLNAVTADLRGNGESAVRPRRGVDFGYQEMVQYDWPAVVGAAARRFPNAPRFLLGHSLGGQLSALYLSAHPDEVAGLILIASASVYYRGWSFPQDVGVLVMSQLARGIADTLGYFPGKRLGFGGLEARTVMRDWSRNARTGRYALTGTSHDYDAALRAVRAPVLGVSIEGDDFAPARAVDNLCAKMPAARLTRWHLGAADLDAPAVGHFDWVKYSAALAPRVATWVRAAT